MATIACTIIEYMHYSRAIEKKKYCVVGAIEVHDSLMHCLSNYLDFLAWHVHLDARCPACSQKDEQSSRKKKNWNKINKNRVGDDGVPVILQYRPSNLYLTDRKETMAILQKDTHTPLHICK